MSATLIHLDVQRLQRLTHYICWVCDEPRLLGPSRLHRILWYAERSLILKSGTPLSGAVFVKRPSSPICTALPHALTALHATGALAIRQHSYARDEEQYFATVDPELDDLPGWQVSIIDKCIHAVCRDGFEIPRQQTHDTVFQIAKMGEEIPNYTAYAGAKGAIDDDDLSWALNDYRLTPVGLVMCCSRY